MIYFRLYEFWATQSTKNWLYKQNSYGFPLARGLQQVLDVSCNLHLLTSFPGLFNYSTCISRHISWNYGRRSLFCTWSSQWSQVGSSNGSYLICQHFSNSSKTTALLNLKCFIKNTVNNFMIFVLFLRSTIHIESKCTHGHAGMLCMQPRVRPNLFSIYFYFHFIFFT